MYGLTATAWQTKSGIAVDVHATLEDGCKRASITGTYPGTIIHIKDPGCAEIFITEWTLPGPCTDATVPWQDHALIRDFHYKCVIIYVNGKKVLTVPVVGAKAYTKASAAGGRNWVVIAHFLSKKPPYGDCRTQLKSAPISKSHYKVFGPNTLAACEAFRRKNCKASRR